MNGMDKFMAVEDSLDMETREIVYNQVVGEDVPFWFYQCYKRTNTEYATKNLKKFHGEFIIIDEDTCPIVTAKTAETYARCMKKFGIEKIMYASKNTHSLDELMVLTLYGGMSLGNFISVGRKRPCDCYKTAIVIGFEKA